MGFGIARFIIGILELVGWLAVAGGTVILGFALVQGAPPVVYGFGGGVILAGLFLVAMAQIVRAQVVTAENSEKLVRILAEHVVASRKGN